MVQLKALGQVAVKKKNIRKSALLLIMIMLATGITACGTEEEPLPDLSAMGAVTAVSREEGSGTRAEFENLLKLPESDTGIVVDSTEKVLKKVEEDIPLVQKWLTDTFQSDSEIVKWASTIEIDPQKIIDSIVSVLRSGADNLVSSTITVTMGLVSMAMNFAIGFVFSCYVLLQKEKLGRQVLKAAYAILPVKTVEYLGHVCTLASKVFSSFITGQCIEAVILGSMFFVSMTIGRFPYAMLIGVLISFTALIPVFGGIIGCWVGFFLILMVSPLKALAFLILFLILQQIEGNLIYPHVVGNSVGLPAIWVSWTITG